MWLFGRVERLQQRLRVMIFIGNFNENVRTIGPQLKAVISASMSIRNSEKLKKILEIILAFGNYMNSGKRGSVYGFKLTSLEALVETKSTDKSQNLLHYICNVVHSYFSDVADFMCEIRYVDQGTVQFSQISLKPRGRVKIKYINQNCPQPMNNNWDKINEIKLRKYLWIL